MKTLLRLGALVLAMAVFSLGCSSRRPAVRQSGENFTNANEPSRLVVQISNVTDENKSRQNQIELWVNGKKLRPTHTTVGGRGEYLYELSLRSGVYKIHGKYRAKSFWKDKEFQLATHDGRVRLYPGYTTFLTMTLEKKSDGSLLRNKVFFTEAPRPMRVNAKPQIAQTVTTPPPIERPRAVFIASKPEAPPEANMAAPSKNEVESATQVERPIIVVPVAPQAAAAPTEPSANIVTPAVSLDRVAVPVEAQKVTPAPEVMHPAIAIERIAAPAAAPVAIAHVETSAAAPGKIALQINTTPANAEVIVDDKYLGQSPLITHVERGRSHVVQISKKGYADKIKLIDRSEFGNQQTYFLIEKLEREE